MLILFDDDRLSLFEYYHWPGKGLLGAAFNSTGGNGGFLGSIVLPLV